MQLTLNKVAAALVAVAMMGGLAVAFTAQRAHALSLSELVDLFIALDVIPADKAEQAKAVLAGKEETSAPACNFTRNLKTGDTGADVKDLQKLLNAKGYTVAASGAGSAGMESEYYGPATAAAVAKMQEAYASEVLAPLGLTAGTGMFGEKTRAKANSLCAAAPSTPSTPETPSTPSSDLSGEASLDTFEMNTADDDTIDEGQDDAVIGEAKVSFVDGDAKITRLDVSIDAPGTTDPWDVFDNVSLWVDGKKVAEKAADNRKDYLDEDNGTLRFSGLDIVAKEDEDVVIQVAVTVMSSVDSGDQGTYGVSVDSMRFVDAEDVTTTDDSTGDLTTPVSFDLGAAGADDELIVKSDSSDPDASTIKVKDDAKSDWVQVFVFDLDTKDSQNDITLNDVYVTVATSGATYATLVDDARLVVDGTTIDSGSSDVTSSSTGAIIDFNVDGDVVINAGDKVKAVLELRFKALAPANEGSQVRGSVTSINADAIDAEGADTLDTTQLSGSATGEWHTLLTKGVYAEMVSSSEDTNSDKNVGTFEMKFDLTAFDDTFYVGSTSASVSFTLEDGDGNTISTTTSAALTSTATKEDGNYRIDEGQTESFTLTITLDPQVSSYYRVQINSVDYGTSSTVPTGSTAGANPAEDFQSGALYVKAS